MTQRMSHRLGNVILLVLHSSQHLVYEDYFGPGNLAVGKSGQERFDLQLELVRELMEESIAVTCGREGY